MTTEWMPGLPTDVLAEDIADAPALVAALDAADHEWTGINEFAQAPTVNGSPIAGDVTQADLAAATASHQNYVVGVGPYAGTAPNRPTVQGAFVLWNGDTDPGSKAADGDLGVGW